MRGGGDTCRRAGSSPSGAAGSPRRPSATLVNARKLDGRLRAVANRRGISPARLGRPVGFREFAQRSRPRGGARERSRSAGSRSPSRRPMGEKPARTKGCAGFAAREGRAGRPERRANDTCRSAATERIAERSPAWAPDPPKHRLRPQRGSASRSDRRGWRGSPNGGGPHRWPLMGSEALLDRDRAPLGPVTLPLRRRVPSHHGARPRRPSQGDTCRRTLGPGVPVQSTTRWAKKRGPPSMHKAHG